MQISILLMEQIFELFLMILMGFIIVKAGIVKEEDSKAGISLLALYIYK
jgi:predicted permease